MSARGVAIVIALSAERGGLHRVLATHSGPRAVRLLQSGPGPQRAAAAAREAIASGASAILSWGLACGLAPQLQAGTVVVPRTVALPGGGSLPAEPAWQRALAAALEPSFHVRDGDLLSVDDVLDSPQAKARAAAATGGIAADMESAAIARVAADAGLPFAALRVVADSLTDSLPPDVGSWIDAAGRQRVAPVVGALLKPAYWPMLAVLARRYRVARRTLAAAAALLAPADFLYPPVRRP
jgi:adenosylhomocysteine nucleosidase